MDKRISAPRKMYRLILTAGALVGLVMVSNLATAQEIEVVTVTAHSQMHKVVGRSASGIPIVEASLSYAVRIADLDLSKASGVTELDNRIEILAKEACKSLDNLYPISPKDPRCVANAINSAADQRKQVIAAAVRK